MEAKKYPVDHPPLRIVSEDSITPHDSNHLGQTQFLQACIAQKDAELLQLRLQIQTIENHTGWKIIKVIDPIFQRFFPSNSIQAKAVKNLIDLLKKTWRLASSKKSNLGSVELKAGYEKWILHNEPDDAQLTKQRQQEFAYQPKISIVTPTWNTPQNCLEEMIDSVLAQTYKNWELCIADGNSSSASTKKILTDYARRDSRIKLVFLDQNLGIAGNSNAALHLASGDFITLLDHDDTLAPFALNEVVAHLQEPGTNVDILYSDEDFINADGSKRFSPTFKPAFGWDTLRSHNYICHLLVFRAEVIKKTGGFRKGFDGSQDYDLVLRACELAEKIVHIPKILYHWRVHPSSTAGNPSAKNYAHDAGRRALQEHLDRCNLSGQASNGLATGLYQAIYHPHKWPAISIIIPSKDQSPLLRACLSSVLETDYPNLEILVLENGSTEKETFDLYEKFKEDSRVRIIGWEKPFSYAAINNHGVKLANGELILFLNNDIKSLKKENLYRLAEHASRPETGVVGAALYYPDDTIQHAGVVLAMTGIAGHVFRNTPRGKLGYGFRMATIRNVSCVTGACMMIKRETFLEAGGFDENLAIAFNDIDLCLKVKNKGLSVVWTPHAEFTHYESKTRGFEDTPEKIHRFQKEIDYFKSKWDMELKAGDELYSPNLDPETETPGIKTSKNI